MASDDIRRVARIPIVPDDFVNHDYHKDHELVMDFNEDDIYVKKGDGYVNITGKIKTDVKQIHDGSSVIHVVTDQTIPPIKDRPENNWYFIVTKATDFGGASIPTASYIYYGLIESYHHDKNYILVAQNTCTGPGTIKMKILEGYSPCIYIPINYGAVFKNHDTGEIIPHVIEDRIYAMNPSLGSYVAYDVYMLSVYDPGEYFIDIDLAGSDHFSIQFDTNSPGIIGLKLPESIKVRDGDCIGAIPDPEWEDPRFNFVGWSVGKIAPDIIDPLKYKPIENMTLFAWFDYNDDPTALTYFAEYTT